VSDSLARRPRVVERLDDVMLLVVVGALLPVTVIAVGAPVALVVWIVRAIARFV
jgi:integral membrane sensor domain MASE1